MTDTMERPSPRCARCKKTPAEIGYDEYLEPGETADDYVRQEEGTYDPATGAFLCDPCYIRVGQPANTFPSPRWTATPGNLASVGL